MPFVEYSIEQGVAVVSLNRPKANALTDVMVAELDAAVDRASEAETRAVILSSSVPKFFCAGFDVKEVFAYDRERITAHLAAFGALVRKLHALPKPTVAAISGHAFGGGAILALACDFRIMGEGEHGFALNEIDIGVVLPQSVLRLLASVAGEGAARRMTLTGEALAPARALALGLVDEVCAADQVARHAMALALGLASKPPQTYAGLKAAIHRATGAPGETSFTPDVSAWLATVAPASAGLRRLKSALRREL